MVAVFYGPGKTIVELGDNPPKPCVARWTGQVSPEPETVAWIKSMPARAAFFDIGANYGTFSVLAALRGMFVTAFEPVQAINMQLLKVLACNSSRFSYQPRLVADALSDYNGAGRIVPGRSSNTVSRTASSGTWVTVRTLDEYVASKYPLSWPWPAYVKIDVDGNEHQIIAGGTTVLSRAKEVLVEIDPAIPEHLEIPTQMRRLGFTFDQAQVDACMVPGGKYKGMANYIFRKM